MKSETSKVARIEINQALAKALACVDCGQFDKAQAWGEVLIRKLELAAVFKAGSVTVENPPTLWVINRA